MIPPLYFSVSLKSVACNITDQWGEFRIKNATLCIHIVFWYFFVFHHKIFAFIVFIFFFFFDEVSNFCNRILKLDSHLSKKFVICLNESPLNMMKDAFYFILKSLFVLKIFKFLPSHFSSCRKKMVRLARYSETSL